MRFAKSCMVSATLALGTLAGCSGNNPFYSNPDPVLNKMTKEEFAADAAKRSPYPQSLARGEAKDAPIAAQIRLEYPNNQVEVENLSESRDYDDVEIWVNKAFVLHVPKIPRKPVGDTATIKHLEFRMFYDGAGHAFELGHNERVQTVEMKLDGKMYNVPIGSLLD